MSDVAGQGRVAVRSVYQRSPGAEAAPHVRAVEVDRTSVSTPAELPGNQLREKLAGYLTVLLRLPWCGKISDCRSELNHFVASL